MSGSSPSSPFTAELNHEDMRRAENLNSPFPSSLGRKSGHKIVGSGKVFNTFPQEALTDEGLSSAAPSDPLSSV